MNRRLLRPAVFGLSDGMMSLLGVLLYLLGHQSLIVPAALSGALSSALSMAGGEWLSDSDSGFGASCVMGVATGVGSMLPALPFLVAKGQAAITASVVICLGIGVVVALMRPNRRPVRALLETGAVLTVIFAAVLACGLVLPGGGS